MLQNIMVVIILIIVSLYVIRHVYRIFSGKNNGCDCSSGTCNACPITDMHGCDDESLPDSTKNKL